MKGIEAVKEAMKRRGVKQAGLAEKVGFNHASGIGEMLRREDIRSGNMVKLLKAMGYELVVRDVFSKEEIIVDGE